MTPPDPSTDHVLSTMHTSTTFHTLVYSSQKLSKKFPSHFIWLPQNNAKYNKKRKLHWWMEEITLVNETTSHTNTSIFLKIWSLWRMGMDKFLVTFFFRCSFSYCRLLLFRNPTPSYIKLNRLDIFACFFLWASWNISTYYFVFHFFNKKRLMLTVSFVVKDFMFMYQSSNKYFSN